VAILLLAVRSAGAADPDPIFAATRAAIAERLIVGSQVLGFHLRDKAFTELPSEGALLIGFDCGVGKFFDIKTVYALRPLYRTARGKTYVRDHGLFADQQLGAKKVLKSKVLETVRILARPGYAVSGITIRAGLNINGLSVTFSRINGKTLDPGKSYESPWVGDRTGGTERSLDGNGAAVVGVFGSEDEVHISSLGLWYLNPLTLPDTQPADQAPEKKPVVPRGGPPPKGADPPPPAPEPADVAPEAEPPAAAQKPPAAPKGTNWLPFVIFGVVTVPVLLGLLVAVGRKGRAQDRDQPDLDLAQRRPSSPPASAMMPPRSGTPLEPRPEPWGSRAGNPESPQNARARKEVLGTLFGIAALQFVFGLIAVTVIPDQIACGPVPPQAIPIMVAIVVGIALAFAGLGWWAQSQPLPAAITGLVLYLVVFLLDFLSNPALVTRGIYVKVAIIAALIRAVQSAAKIDTRWKPEAQSWLPEERRPASSTVPWGGAEGRPDRVADPDPGILTPERLPPAGSAPLGSTGIREGSPLGGEPRPESLPSSPEALPISAQREVADELLRRIHSQEERPWWVQIGLWGIHSRSTAWVFVWIALFLTVVPPLCFFSVNKGVAVFGLFGLAALWYWLCIRWVDEHGSWS
jgi:hypothetical protein